MKYFQNTKIHRVQCQYDSQLHNYITITQKLDEKVDICFVITIQFISDIANY